MLGDFRLDVRMLWKSFPTQGSHNIMLSTKDLKYQIVGRRTEKLTERFVGPYKVKKIVLENVVELELPSTIKICLVVNISSVTNFIWTITPGILNQFQQSKWPPKALKKTFQTVPKMSQSNQYSPSYRYQQISQ